MVGGSGYRESQRARACVVLDEKTLTKTEMDQVGLGPFSRMAAPGAWNISFLPQGSLGPW